MRYTATTCIECGAYGQEESADDAVIHKTILCSDCGARGNDGTKPHPEDFCEKCGGENIVWFVSSELWNEYARSQGYGILCPVCFAKLAEAAGLMPTAWELKPEQQK